jgi:hypothetical protein
MDEHDEHLDLRGSGYRSIIPYVHGRDGCCITMCLLKSWLSLLKLSLQRACPDSVVAPSFYSTMQGSYKKTRSPTCGPEVIETLYNI